MNNTAALCNADDGWHAQLELAVERAAGATRLSRCRHTGPLYVQKPFYPEGREHAHLYLLHPPGGIVSGDSIDISVVANAGAGVLVTTPGAARVYRARDRQALQRQSVHLRIGAGAAVEWFPLETIVYNGANVELDTHIDLDDGSCFIGWEITCFGLPASAEPFKQGRFRQHYLLRRNGQPLFVERLLLDRRRSVLLNGRVAMRGCTASGFFLAGPIAEDARSPSQPALLAALRDKAQQLDMATVAAISRVGEFYIGRYLGNSAEQGRKVFTAWWRLVRPALLQREACAPRIWLT